MDKELVLIELRKMQAAINVFIKDVEEDRFTFTSGHYLHVIYLKEKLSKVAKLVPDEPS